MKLIPLTIGAVFIVASTMADAGLLVPNKTIDIAFDGFCDGMHLVINHSTGTVTGNRTGCVPEYPLAGYVGAVSGGVYDGQAAVVGFMEGTTGFMTIISDVPRKWQHIYLLDGSAFNSGTWSKGVPAMEMQGVAPASSD